MNEINAAIPQYDYVNEFTIRGNVIKKISTPKAMILRIAASNPVTQKRDFPSVVIYDKELMQEMDEKINIGDRVSAEGIVQTSRKYPAGTLVANSCVVENNRMDAKFSGKEYREDVNEVLMRGRIILSPYCPNDKVTILAVELQDKNGNRYFPRIVCFGAQARRMKSKAIGDSISALCYVQTNEPRDDKKVSPQSFIAQNSR